MPAVRAIDADLADDEPLRVDAVEARRHDDVADADLGQRGDVLHPQHPAVVADDDAARPRALDHGAPRRRCGPRAAARARRARRRGPADHPAHDARAARAPPCRPATPSAVPRSIVTVRNHAVASPAMTSAASVRCGTPRLQPEQRLEALARAAPARAAPAGGSRARPTCARSRALSSCTRQRRRSAPTARPARDASSRRRAAPRRRRRRRWPRRRCRRPRCSPARRSAAGARAAPPPAAGRCGAAREHGRGGRQRGLHGHAVSRSRSCAAG